MKRRPPVLGAKLPILLALSAAWRMPGLESSLGGPTARSLSFFHEESSMPTVELYSASAASALHRRDLNPTARRASFAVQSRLVESLDETAA
jgi:hypothetical protein